MLGKKIIASSYPKSLTGELVRVIKCEKRGFEMHCSLMDPNDTFKVIKESGAKNLRIIEFEDPTGRTSFSNASKFYVCSNKKPLQNITNFVKNLFNHPKNVE